MMKLYTYFRSSASYRIRIALHLKGLNADHVPVHLVKGEQVGADYLAKNPKGLSLPLMWAIVALSCNRWQFWIIWKTLTPVYPYCHQSPLTVQLYGQCIR